MRKVFDHRTNHAVDQVEFERFVIKHQKRGVCVQLHHAHHTSRQQMLVVCVVQVSCHNVEFFGTKGCFDQRLDCIVKLVVYITKQPALATHNSGLESLVATHDNCIKFL